MKNRSGKWNLLANLAALLAVCAPLKALSAEAPDPLLDLFVKKGFVTEQEAQRVKAEADALRASAATNGTALMSESKWKIGKAIKNVELFGDVRVRYEERAATDPAGGKITLDRARYAFRVGLRGEVYDHFYFGTRIDTSSNGRSSWATFGSGNSPFGKSSGGISVGQLYLGWRPADWAEVTLGKMPNPFYTTSMVWDGDLSPEGAAEHFKCTIGNADLFLNFGQFVYQDVNPTHTANNYFGILYNEGNTPFLLGWQIGLNYHITDKLSFKVAPVLYNYTGRGANNTGTYSPGFSDTFVGQGSSQGIGGNPAYYNLNLISGYNFNGFFSNETGINNLMVLEIPWELNLKLDPLNIRLFGDYAQNLQGGDRARAAFNAQQNIAFQGSYLIRIPTPQTQDNKAYQFGLAVGNRDALGLVSGAVSRKNAWEFRTYWQHVEQYALDPNLLDSDFFEGRGNLEGIYAAFAYGLGENVIGTVRYGHAHRINDKLGTGGSNQDIPQMNPIQSFDLLQFDLTLKF